MPAVPFRQRHQYDAELGPYGICLRKDSHDFVRRGVGGDVVVGGFASEQEVAHAPADEVTLVATVAECADNRDGEGLRHGLVFIIQRPYQRRWRMGEMAIGVLRSVGSPTAHLRTSPARARTPVPPEPK